MGIFNNQAALNFNTDQQIDTMLDYWNYAEAQMTTRDEVTDHMFDRLDAFVIGPKFGRAYRRAKNMANNGPHQSRCRKYRGTWDRIDTQQRIDRMNRFRDAEMRAEAAAHMDAGNDNETDDLDLRRPAYADCADYYYETLFNPEVVRDNERAEEDRFYWEY